VGRFRAGKQPKLPNEAVAATNHSNWRAIQKVHVYRRIDSGFDHEVYTGLDAIIPLPEIKCELALQELYQNVQFAPAISDDES